MGPAALDLRCAGMAQRPFKVFRTSAGFEDAYVAAKSQKAALEAWGARSNLFASGMAEIVTDPQLTGAALAHPGKVIRAPRRTPAQYLAAADASRPRPAKSRRKGQDGNSVAPSLAQAKPKPKPSRSRLDNATHALEEQRRQFADALSEIDRQIADLRQERETLRSKRDLALAKLEERRDRGDEAYRSALDRWRGQNEP